MKWGTSEGEGKTIPADSAKGATTGKVDEWENPHSADFSMQKKGTFRRKKLKRH